MVDDHDILVSVIIPAFNVAAYIGDAIDSVCRQGLERWECLVVDDGSTDDTIDRVRAVDDRRVRLLQQRNAGVSAARNTGISAASGRYLFFLDGDDFIFSDTLERLVAPLEASPGLVASYGESVVVDAGGNRIGTGKPPLFHPRPSGIVLNALLKRNLIVTGTICVRRASVQEVGGFNTGLSIAEDWEFWCRLASRGPFHYVSSPPVLAYRMRPDSAVRSRGYNIPEALRAVECVFSNPELQGTSGRRGRHARRQAVASVYEFAANECLRRKDWPRARHNLLTCLALAPTRWRAFVLLVIACIQWLPAVVLKHLK